MRPKTVLVTGGTGLLGGALLRSAPTDVQVHATWRRRRPPDLPELFHRVDLADRGSTRRLLLEQRPDLVLHTAYDKVDGRRDILEASASVAEGCAETGTELIHLSSDVVFDGEHAPYAEDAAVGPVHDYGRWKADAEQAVVELLGSTAIVRTSLIVSAEPLDHTSRWIAQGLGAGEELGLFVDELRCPIAVTDLSAMLWELSALPVAQRAGTWHLAGPEAVSRMTLGLLVARRLDLEPRFITARNAEHPEPRPRDLRLTTARADAALKTQPRTVSAVFSPA